MLNDATPTDKHRRRRVAGYMVLGILSGAFSSWYIYGNVWSWPLYVLIAACMGGALLEERRRESRR